MTFIVENTRPSAAEKAYYRLASVYLKDGLMQQALECCNQLLARYPNTTRRRDTSKLMLEISRGLRDYRNVLPTLRELLTSAKDGEKRALQSEMAGVYYDLADYAKAAEVYAALLDGAGYRERSVLKDAQARCMLRLRKLPEAQKLYDELADEQKGTPLGSAAKLMSFYCRLAQGNAQEHEFPPEADRFRSDYEHKSADERAKLSPAFFARAMLVYYVQGLIDLEKGRPADAITRLNAAQTSPEDVVAGDAGLMLCAAHMAARNYSAARKELEFLVASPKSAEAWVRGCYYLGKCLRELKEDRPAYERWARLVERCPDSPLSELVRKDPWFISAAPTTQP